ncbi:MAG TPA: NADP-dependent oxidoreductase [Granulicella sp.]
MKAVVLHEYGGPEKLLWEDVDDPRPTEDELLIHVSAAGINPVDWKMRSGEAHGRFPVTFPGILGRDLSGVIREVGPRVKGFAPGDRVLAFTHSTYAELAVTRAEETVKIPEGMDTAEAAALPLVLLTGEQLISRAVKIESGQTVLVTGALGGVGRSAVWTAKKAGARVIAGVRKRQLKAAEELGADQVLALDDEQALASLGFVDAVADVVGGEVAATLLGKVKPGGVFGSVVGMPSSAALHPTVRVEAIMAKPDAAKLRELAEDVQAKKLRIPIDRVIPMADAGKGQAAAEKGGLAGKVLLIP